MNKPTMIQLESSTKCDAKCDFCPHSKLQRPGGEMSDATFEKILQGASNLDICEILLFLNGEPLRFPRLFKWLQRLREKNCATTLFTNANALNLEKAEAIIGYSDVIRTVVFSLGGYDEKTYRDIMNLSYYRVRRNVENFCALNHEGKIKTAGHIPMYSRTAGFIGEWTQLWKPIVGQAAATSMYNFAGLISDTLELKEDDNHRRAPCSRLNHITILHDGRVCLCCMDAEGDVILGDVNEQSLSEIYDSPFARHYRKLHAQGRFSELPLCRDCNMNIINFVLDSIWK